MTYRDQFKAFAQSVGFITPQSASYIRFGDCTRAHQTHCANELRKMIGSEDDKGNVFRRMASSARQAIYGYGEKKSPRRHDILNNQVAGKVYHDTGQLPKLDKHSDFVVFFHGETDMGTEGFEGNRQIEQKLDRACDGRKLLFFCTDKFSSAPDRELNRCNLILDWVDKYRQKRQKSVLSVYVIPLTGYLKGTDTRPWSRKKNGQLVKDLEI